MFPRDLLQTTSRSWNIELSPAQLDQFERYAQLLLAWNAHTNLTAITTIDEVVVRHFLDSLALAQLFPDPPTSLADIGTGAGFPGVPLKIIWPHTRLLLADSVGKKTDFLRHLVDDLALADVDIQMARAEELGQNPRYREQFAAVTARAVASLSVLAEYCLPLCAIGGTFVAPKGADAAREAEEAERAVQQLGGEIDGIVPVQLPGVEAHHLVVIRKTRSSPAHYPRRTGIPLKHPL
jgi:16S rRNA (guanine527-N7)-methyltransferase